MKSNTDEVFYQASQQIKDLMDRYARQHLKVRIVHNDKQPNEIAHFLIQGDGWEERINTLAALYGWLNGFTRAKSIIL